MKDKLTIESVQLKLSIAHERDADLAIELTSPSGTTSMVLQPQTLILEDQLGDTEANFNNSVLASHAFYGELANLLRHPPKMHRLRIPLKYTIKVKYSML